jgi:hypothetical protein
MNDKWPPGIWPAFPALFSNDIESPGYTAACMRSCGTELPCFGAASSSTNILAAIPARSQPRSVRGRHMDAAARD